MKWERGWAALECLTFSSIGIYYSKLTKIVLFPKIKVVGTVISILLPDGRAQPLSNGPHQLKLGTFAVQCTMYIYI